MPMEPTGYLLIDTNDLVYLAKAGGRQALDGILTTGYQLVLTDTVEREATQKISEPDAVLIQEWLSDNVKSSSNPNGLLLEQPTVVEQDVLNGVRSPKNAGEDSIVEAA